MKDILIIVHCFIKIKPIITTLKGEKLQLKKLGNLEFFDEFAVFCQNHFSSNNGTIVADLVINSIPIEECFKTFTSKRRVTGQPVLFLRSDIASKNKTLLPPGSISIEEVTINNAEFHNLKAKFLVKNFLNKNLPGRCGLLLSTPDLKDKRLTRLKKITTQFAQSRLRLKAKNFLPLQGDLKDLNLEQVLYEIIFEAFGHKNFATVFRQLATDFSYSKIRQLWVDQPDTWHDYLLAFWLGKLNLFKHIPIDQQKILPITTLKNIWEHQNQPRYATKISLAKVNPNGHPVRRLLSMLQFLQHTKQLGLLASWLNFFKDATNLSLESWQNSKALKKMINPLFSGIKGHPYLFQSLTGQSRISGIMVNALLPAFLLFSKELKMGEFSSLLFKIYYTLPGEIGLNRSVRDMQVRLANPAFKPPFKNSLAYSQGMLQICKDLCLSFQDGCQKCVLSGWLE